MSQERFVPSFDGTSIYLRTSGTGPPIVLCDGIACNGFIWKYLETALARDHQIVRWHYRGHGNSAAPQNREAVTIADLCGDLLALLDNLGIEKPVLLGHSMGVQVTAEFAIQHPERITALGAICGTYGRPGATFHDSPLLGMVLPHLNEVVSLWPDKAQRFWSRMLRSELLYQYSLHGEVDGTLVKREDFKPYFDHVASMDVQLFVRMLLAANNHTTEERLHEIAVPTLVAAGDRDKFSPVWLARRMHRLIPNSELLIIPNGTHVAPLEQPELLLLRLTRFLEERVRPAVKAPAKRRAVRRKTGAAAAREAAKG